MENSINEQFISFKFPAVLRSVTKSCSIPLPPAWDVTRPFVQHLCTVGAPTRQSLSSHPGGQLSRHGIPVLVFRPSLFYLIMAPKHKSGDAGSVACQREAVQGFL